MMMLGALLTSVVITSLTIPVLQRFALRYQLVDMPSVRKVHQQPIPRIGGVAMALGTFVPLFALRENDPYINAYLASAGIIVIFGIMDDLRDLSPLWKFIGQGISAAIMIGVGEVRISTLGSLLPDGVVLPFWLGIVLTIIVIVGVTNAINLADGLDGLAGGISLLSLAAIGYLAWLEGDATLGLIALVICGAVFGFLRYNSYPAAVFMGDTGSQLLGFTAISLALKLTQGVTPLSPVLPLVILGFPVLDTLTVMSGRIIRGRSPFSADKTHFHHNLLSFGFHHTESVLVIYLTQVSLILAAFYLRFYSDWFLLGGYLLFSVTVLTLFNVSIRKGWEPKRAEQIVHFKAYLRMVREKTDAIVYLFGGICVLFPAVLALSVLLAAPPSGEVAAASAVAALLLAIVGKMLPDRQQTLLRVVIYLLVPITIFHADTWLANAQPILGSAYTMLFGVLGVLNILVTKLTRRKEGFASSPLDFLIFFLAVVAPNIQTASAVEFRMGLVGAKVIILYYGCEVLLAELRDNCTIAVRGIYAVLGLLTVRWFV